MEVEFTNSAWPNLVASGQFKEARHKASPCARKIITLPFWHQNHVSRRIEKHLDTACYSTWKDVGML
jgi:hypothetical protein